VGADRRSQGAQYAQAYRESTVKTATDELVASLLRQDSMLVTEEVRASSHRSHACARLSVRPWWC